MKAIHDANENENPIYKVEKLGRWEVSYSKNVVIDGKTFEIGMLSNPKITNVDLSNYLFTPSGKAFYRTGKFMRISFRDVAAPKRVFDIVVNESDADEIGRYLLGDNWQNDFSPMDKSWILYLHSPEQSEKFLAAYTENDLLEQRRISYYALTNGFVDSNGNESNWVQNQFDTNPYNYSATLKNNPLGEKGITVYLYEKDENGYVRLKQEPIQYNPYVGSNYDATYPVDVDLYDGPKSPPLGKIKYKDYDFNGNFIEADASIGGTYGFGIIAGKMKGFGYLEFTYDVMGLTWPIGAGITAGLIEGSFIRAGGGIPSPNSFRGYGYAKFFQGGVMPFIGLSTGTWYGVGESASDKTWEGKNVGASFSISSASLKGLWQNLNNAGGGQVQTRTELIYPKMSSKTFNILDAYYDKP